MGRIYIGIPEGMLKRLLEESLEVYREESLKESRLAFLWKYQKDFLIKRIPRGIPEKKPLKESWLKYLQES